MYQTSGKALCSIDKTRSNNSKTVRKSLFLGDMRRSEYLNISKKCVFVTGVCKNSLNHITKEKGQYIKKVNMPLTISLES